MSPPSLTASRGSNAEHHPQEQVLYRYDSRADVASDYPDFRFAGSNPDPVAENDRIIRALWRVFTEYPNHDLIETTAECIDSHPAFSECFISPPCLFAHVKDIDRAAGTVKMANAYPAVTLFSKALLLVNRQQELADAITAARDPATNDDVQRQQRRVKESERELTNTRPVYDTRVDGTRGEPISLPTEAVTIRRCSTTDE